CPRSDRFVLTNISNIGITELSDSTFTHFTTSKSTHCDAVRGFWRSIEEITTSACIRFVLIKTTSCTLSGCTGAGGKLGYRPRSESRNKSYATPKLPNRCTESQ